MSILGSIGLQGGSGFLSNIFGGSGAIGSGGSAGSGGFGSFIGNLFSNLGGNGGDQNQQNQPEKRPIYEKSSFWMIAGGVVLALVLIVTLSNGKSYGKRRRRVR